MPCAGVALSQCLIRYRSQMGALYSRAVWPRSALDGFEHGSKTRPKERPMTYNGFLCGRTCVCVRSVSSRAYCTCPGIQAHSVMSCCQYRVLQMRLSVHFREAAVPVGQARPHPAICNSSRVFPQPHWSATTLVAQSVTTGASHHRRPKESQLTAAQAKLLFMRREKNQDT